MSRMNWSKASSRDRVLERGGDRIDPEDRTPRSRKSKRGISNEQAKVLARLQRRAGERYSGNGMSWDEAERAIQRLSRGGSADA